MPEEINKYIGEVARSASLNADQEQRLKHSLTDLTQLMLEAALNPEDTDVLTEIKLCKVTIESLGVVSFNQVKDKASDIAKDVFMKGLSIALASL